MKKCPETNLRMNDGLIQLLEVVVNRAAKTDKAVLSVSEQTRVTATRNVRIFWDELSAHAGVRLIFSQGDCWRSRSQRVAG